MNDCLGCKWPQEKRPHTCAVRTDPNYARQLSPEAAAWLAEHHNPRFKPRRVKYQSPGWGGRARLTAEQFDKAMRENLRAYGTPRQIAEYWREAIDPEAVTA